MESTFLFGPSYSTLQNEVFERAQWLSSTNPESVIWLDGNSHRQSYIADAWATEYSALQLRVTSLDNFVSDYYDRIAGPATLLDVSTRRRLIDQALRTLAEDDLFADAHRFRGEFSALFNTLEENGYATPETIEALVEESDLSERAAKILTESYRRFSTYREDILAEAEYTQHDAYESVLNADESITDVFPTADVVVVAGYYELTTNQQQFLEHINDDVSLIVTLPTVACKGEEEAERTGADAAVAETDAFYRSLTTNVSRITTETDQLQQLAGTLYTPGSGDTEDPPETLEWVQTTTPDREIRHVARSIRQRLSSDDTTPDDILVVIPGLLTYREAVEEVFGQYDLVASASTTRLLYQTYTGRAILDAVALCEESTPSVETAASLLTNPIADIDGNDHAAVSEFSRRLPTDDVAALMEHVELDTEKGLSQVLEQADSVSSATGTEVIAELKELLTLLDIENQLERIDEEDGDLPFNAAMEHRAYQQVNTLFRATERVIERFGPYETLSEISDELDQLQVSAPRQSTAGVIEVVGIEDSFMQDFEHLYFMDLVERDFPVDPERPRFFEQLEDGLAGIDSTNYRAEARYQFATLLASSETVHLTTPQTTNDDTPLLASAVLDELQRITGIEPSSPDNRNGSPEDVQRAVGRIRTQSAHEAVDEAISTNVFGDPATEFVQQGVTCAQNRASTGKRTYHDGQVDSEVVDALHPRQEREGYSPTRLTTYAKCGFRYYADNVIDLDTPEEITLEPDPLEVGNIIHDTLEAFYTRLQEEPGDPVDLSEWDQESLEEQLLTAGGTVLEAQDLGYDDAFYSSWLETLFAGLCDSDRNEHYGGSDSLHDESAGVFARFLEYEIEQDGDPAWFEVNMDFSNEYPGEVEITLPDGRSISIGGRIDRVTLDRSETPPTAKVQDYKTSSQNIKQTIDGVAFQLPLYALAASNALDESDIDTPADAGFYIVDPPDEVKESWPLTYYIGRMSGSDTPEADYERLLETITPERLQATVDGIEGGAFQPTIVDAGTAGCRYCDYSDICDVRHHQSSDIITTIDTDDRPGYVPQIARDSSLLDQFGGDEE